MNLFSDVDVFDCDWTISNLVAPNETFEVLHHLCINNVAHKNLELPCGTGVEAVGTVVAVGASVDSSRLGQAVSTVCVGQGYCDYQVIDQEQAIPVPEATAQVLALIPTGVSALVALEQVAELKGNEVVAVSAAGGGLGHIVAQLALLAGNHDGADDHCLRGGQLKCNQASS